MQPLPHGARRCPNCRTPRPAGKGLPIFLGVATLLALIVLVYMMLTSVTHEESGQATSSSQSDKTPPLNK